MVTDAMIQRINELAKKAKNEGLTPEEKEEQQKLRTAYVAGFKQSLRAQLDSSVILRPDGTKEAVRDRKKS
ncbi:MAG: DUF896 domain-containing protein [Clostridia bacterium]|nr:DUF896 domain-containing protein [Clostridia bacterium]